MNYFQLTSIVWVIFSWFLFIQAEDKLAGSEDNLVEAKERKEGDERKKRRGKSSIAPQPELAD